MSSQASSDSFIDDLGIPSDTGSASLSNVLNTLRPVEKRDSGSTVPRTTEQQSSEGSECAIQVLYEGPPKCQCCKNWVEEYPDDLRRQVEDQAAIKQKAFIKRMRKNHDDGKPLVLDSIVVQSSSLKKTLGEVFDGYKGITPSLKKVVFKSPFHPFYHRWGLFTEIVERQKREDTASAAYSVLLYNELQKELGDVMSEIHDHIHHGVITYQLLWALFEPGELIVASKGGHERFYVVQGCKYNAKDGYLAVTANFVDWDGRRFGYAKETLAICEYPGTQAITSLSAYPADLHPSQDEARVKAINRGQKFRDLRGFQYKAYSGLTANRGSVKIDGRIVVDASSYFHANPDEQETLGDLDSESIAPQMNVMEETHVDDDDDDYGGWRCGTGRRRESRRRERLKQRKIENGEISEEREPDPVYDLTDEQLLLCSTRVRGYSLKLKRWVLFDLKNISDIAWNDGAFPKLMLPNGYQNLILSFVEAQSDKKLAFDDIIEGKGMGVIMLLVGQPGTGKTLTAEAVADKVRKPLYMLSAGELGQDAQSVEDRLRTVLELTEKWDAVLLFDECDVFLQERSIDNMAHNEIVAVFLRLLEYYRGIMLMTTNRANAIDRAFQSRIHLTLHYPELNSVAKEHIWKQFTSQLEQDSTLTDDVYSRLAQLPMNGRQIKNTVKIAALLAHKEKAELSIEHVRTVLHATSEAHGEII
ncbi:hypothetical protein Aspvir_009675 [Aspergillus viridinutans]|uniref:AAA+ ATPase domain-containing protein n=1 Tax=Aspergillus viridinutans TaxID=75553 RepID=A0A9P3F4S0_ASPVI|nr:uncharacterized protein Aspvir_009675 [Aspergillus viridinutans]GIK05562.1 hypothetical protein Aspvir_009675 [Aspergillus viridinutans]